MPRVLLKRSTVSGKVPTAADLNLGELATNTTDGKFFFKKGNDVLDLSAAVDATKIPNIATAIEAAQPRNEQFFIAHF